MTRYSPEKIIEATMTSLRAQADEIIAKMLGMDNRWGRWEVDHCNGRESPIANYVTQAAKNEINLFLQENITQEKLRRSIPKASVDAIMRDAKQCYIQTLRNRVTRLVSEHAEQEANVFVKGLINELREQCAAGKTADREVDGQEGRQIE